ncbi:MAG: VWA domain-containing protein [Bacteroidales bacterium]|nr:VWA domain-containing protein [Bacteroidales bacterium]
MVFANPATLYLLVIIPVMIAYYVYRQNWSSASVRLSSLAFMDSIKPGFRDYLKHTVFAFRVIIVTLLIVILARPQSSDKWQDMSTEGIDIMLAMDISGSMLARDFKPDRLEAAKNVATEFISGRPTDRIGLVIFSGESFTQCPLTTDHAVLINLLREMESGMIEDGTAIGLGLANAVNRIKDSDAKSKVIILLTDGVNNRGAIAPLTAAEIAKTMNLRVYTIGVGTHGMAPYPVQTAAGTRYQNMQVEIDEDVLTKIAVMTGGRYFRATDNESLLNIYKEIDKLEKSKIDVQEFSIKNEKYLLFALLAVSLLLAEIVLKKTLLKRDI